MLYGMTLYRIRSIFCEKMIDSSRRKCSSIENKSKIIVFSKRKRFKNNLKAINFYILCIISIDYTFFLIPFLILFWLSYSYWGSESFVTLKGSINFHPQESILSSQINPYIYFLLFYLFFCIFLPDNIIRGVRNISRFLAAVFFSYLIHTRHSVRYIIYVLIYKSLILREK